MLDARQDQKEVILFIDDLPSLDTLRSGFIKAIDLFWNGWAVRQKNVKLIACGSATPWINDNIIDKRSDLHNCVTHVMHIHPLTLHETEKYFLRSHFVWNRISICQAYMIFGGIPYYFSKLDNRHSLAQNIDRLYFSQDGELRQENDLLLKSIFRKPEPYIAIIRLLAQNKKGLTRSELCDNLDKETALKISVLLKNLENCELIRRYNVREKRIKTYSGIYKLTDFFMHFDHEFGNLHNTDEHYWFNNINTPKQNNWYESAFERLCMEHISKIKKALGIHRIGFEYYTWRSKESKPAIQIDLIFERSDQIINLCEIKYCRTKYSIDIEEEEKLSSRAYAFEHETKAKAAVHQTLITTYGLNTNIHSSEIADVITMNDLF